MLVATVVVGIAASQHTVSATTTSTSATTTTTTTPAEVRQAGWQVVSASSRGVMVDFRDVSEGGAVFRVLRLRARTTLLRWHVGGIDPNLWAMAPIDAAPRIDWTSEGPAGIVAVFNGGFKQSAHAGGAVVDGVVMISLVPGDMTIAIDRAGHWEMGVWGARNFPTTGFHPIAYRQNLTPMVLHGAPSAQAHSSSASVWGSPLNNNALTARTGLGVDARGNLLYVASMTGVLPIQLAQELVAAGALEAMQLDINPFWPIMGAPIRPVHNTAGVVNVQLPNQQHSPTIYETGWQRDFFVALAEPNSWACSWQSPGVHVATKGVQPQPLSLSGRGCRPRRTPTSSSTSSTTVPATSTTTPLG